MRGKVAALSLGRQASGVSESSDDFSAKQIDSIVESVEDQLWKTLLEATPVSTVRLRPSRRLEIPPARQSREINAPDATSWATSCNRVTSSEIPSDTTQQGSQGKIMHFSMPLHWDSSSQDFQGRHDFGLRNGTTTPPTLQSSHAIHPCISFSFSPRHDSTESSGHSNRNSSIITWGDLSWCEGASAGRDNMPPFSNPETFASVDGGA